MNLDKMRIYGTVSLSVLAYLTFLGAMIWSFVLEDSTMMSLTVGAAVANATTAINWWLGSSKGSEKKDDVIAASQPPAQGNAGPP